jgi:hypothetical protein
VARRAAILQDVVREAIDGRVALDAEARAADAEDAGAVELLTHMRERGVELAASAKGLPWLRRLFRAVHVQLLRCRVCFAEREFARRCQAVEASIASRRKQIMQMQANPEHEVAQRMALEVHRVCRLENLAASPEAAGADGELRVMEALRELPDTYYVLNDVHLKAPGFMRDVDGIPILSAQIDHVVIGPTGVFVLETKNWSAAFINSGRGFNPSKQVARAGRLLYVLLKKAGSHRRVQNLLVSNGNLNRGDETSHTTCVKPERLLRWIRHGRDILSDDQVSSVVRLVNNPRG